MKIIPLVRPGVIATGSLLAFAAAAQAQYAISWSSIDCGGTTTPISGGAFTVAGTVGQPDAGALSGGAYTIIGGFWAGEGSTCYANCDNSTASPILNALDFGCFLSKFAAADSYANCDNSTTAPLLNALDFGCFLTKFAAGCT